MIEPRIVSASEFDALVRVALQAVADEVAAHPLWAFIQRSDQVAKKTNLSSRQLRRLEATIQSIHDHLQHIAMVKCGLGKPSKARLLDLETLKSMVAEVDSILRQGGGQGVHHA